MLGLFDHRWGARVRFAVVLRAMAACVLSKMVTTAEGGVGRVFSLKLLGFLVKAQVTQFGSVSFWGFSVITRRIAPFLRALVSWSSKRVIACLNCFQVVTTSMLSCAFLIAFLCFLPRSPSETTPKQGVASSAATWGLVWLNFSVRCFVFPRMVLSSLVFCWSSTLRTSPMGVAVKVVGAVIFLCIRPISWRLLITRWMSCRLTREIWEIAFAVASPVLSRAR